MAQWDNNTTVVQGHGSQLCNDIKGKMWASAQEVFNIKVKQTSQWNKDI